MSNLILLIENWLKDFSNVVSIEVFAALGSLVEEIVAPIPSPLVMFFSGTILEAQSRSFIWIIYIGLISAIFKTLAQWGFYYLADKTEDIASSKIGKFAGISVTSIEKIGKNFKGGFRDELIIILGRALPILPSAVISVGAGLIKLNLKVFLRGSLIGNFIRSIFFSAIGFYGLASYDVFNSGFSTAEDYLRIGFLIVAGCIGLYVLYKRKRNKDR
jgi:membrane protein DedA with SNARE-associated domain